MQNLGLLCLQLRASPLVGIDTNRSRSTLGASALGGQLRGIKLASEYGHQFRQLGLLGRKAW